MACTYTLSGLVYELAIRAGMDPRQIDVSQLAGEVRGFAITNSYTAVDALRVLSQVFFFEPSSVDGRIRFVHRGRNAVATITEDDLLDDEKDIEVEKRGDPITVPRVLNLSYNDVLGNLATDKQTSERSGDRRATGEAQLATAVLFSADEAATVVAINHSVLIEDAKGELHWSLSDKFIRLTEADAIFIQWLGRTERIRIIKVDVEDGYQEYVGIRDRQSAYTKVVEGFPASPVLLPADNAVGPTLLEILDIPILNDVDDGLGLSLYVAVSGVSTAWQAAVVELSYDEGQNYTQARDANVQIIMGETVTGMSDHPSSFPDVTNTIRVRIDTSSSELEETDLAGMMNGLNLAIVGDEIIAFANADEVEPGVWDLSLLLRGRKHTQTLDHVAGERFVMLDELSPLPASVTDLGRTLTFRATTFGAADDDPGTVKQIVYRGRSQIEFPVGYLTARREGSTAVVDWQGAGRLGAGATVAHGARFAGYRVTFDNGSTEVVVDTPAQTLTQDVSGLPGALTITVQQLNDITGPGPATEVLLP